MATERLLVLASSKKLGFRCVAGISLETDRWVRPVSAVGGGALSTYHCGVDGRYPQLREIVRFETQGACPLPGQPENVLVGVAPWELENRLTPEETADIVERHLVEGPELLGGLSDTISVAAVENAPVDASLAVLEPQDLEFEHERVPWGSGSRVWARFSLGGAYHAVRLTDVVVRPWLLRHEPGVYALEDMGIDPATRIALTVSLGDAFDGTHYKLAAAVLKIG